MNHRLRSVGILVFLAVGMTPSRATSAPAQVTYSVFPAKSAEQNPAATQPTRHGVTLVLSDSTIKFVVNELARQAHFRPTFFEDPALAKRVSVNIVDGDALKAIMSVLRGTGLTAKLASDGETIMIRGQSRASSGERSRITGGSILGRVTDSASGAGLRGASVRVEGTKVSAVTSDSGRFTLKDVPPGDQVLLVRLFGYRPTERSVTVVDSVSTTIHIVMASVPTVLSGVVTTATGVQRKVEVGNDITSIDVDSVMKVAPISTVTDLLETRVPGLTVLHSSGTPGDPSRIRLRGAGSLQLNNDPVVIVDGVRVYASQSDTRNANLAPSHTGGGDQGSASGYAAPSPLDQIDPNTIATIEVFKGPSATAIYGSDAAAGVIVITTKHGHAGPTRWTLGLGQGVNWIPGTWPVNYYRFGSDNAVHTGANGLCLWTDLSCTVDSVVPFQALNDPRYTVLSHGSDQTANLTISGGVPTLQYSLTGSAAGDMGNLKLPGIEKQRFEQFYGPIPGWMVRPDNYQTWGVGGALSAQPSATARVTLTSSLFNSTQQRSSLEQAIANLEGEYINPDSVFPPKYGAQGFSLGTSPLIQNDVERATDHQLASTNALTLSWQPYAWLPLSAAGGINTIQRTDNTYIPYGVNYGGAGSCDLGPANPCDKDTTGSYGLGRGTSQNNTLTVGTAIPLLRQRMTLAVGANYSSESTADFSAYTNQLAPGVSQPSTFPTPGANVNSTFNQQTSAASTYGWYVEPQLNFNSRFFVAPGFRLDGGSGGNKLSSSTGSLGGLSAFPKVDFSWIAVDRQGTRPLLGVLTLLRPRVAFGLAGTQPGPADRLRLFNVGQFELSSPGGNGSLAVNTPYSCNSTLTLDGGASTVPAVCLNSLGNTQLRPERSTELEGGFDATLWQGRLSLTYTQYDKTRHDAILAIPVAPSVMSLNGEQTSYEKNIGVIRNTGTEVTLNAFVLQSRALSWNVGANLSNDNNLVVRLNPGQAPFCLDGSFTQGGSCIKPGYPIFGLWAPPIVFFADANHDGIIEPNEIRLADSAVFLGQANPKYQFNLNTGLTLLNGRLSINATFAYQNGLTQTNQGALTSGVFVLLPNAPNTPLATQAAIMAHCSGQAIDVQGDFSGQLERDCSDLVSNAGLTQTANTFRFSDLSINYEVPKSFSTLLRVPRMTLALQGSNLALHTNYRGKDPAVNAFSTVRAGDETADTGQIPAPRTWWLKMTMGN